MCGACVHVWLGVWCVCVRDACVCNACVRVRCVRACVRGACVFAVHACVHVLINNQSVTMAMLTDNPNENHTRLHALI